jgi:hypothetical protein
MTALGHAEAHEQIADLALEPGALDRLGSPDSDPLAAHVSTCRACQGEVRAWRETNRAVEAARGSGLDRLDLADIAADDSIHEPIGLPVGLRDAVLETIRDRPTTAGRIDRSPEAAVEPQPIAYGVGPIALQPQRRRGPGGIARRLLPLVAVLGIVAVGAGLLVDQSARLDRARQQAAGLEALAATVDRVLVDPDHRVVSLRGADGTASGSISWSRHDIVVLAMALEPPPPDRVYRCWIERDGARSPVGQMWFSGDVAYWSGSLDEWATTSFDGGGTFGVSLEPVSGSAGNPAVLVADLGS